MLADRRSLLAAPLALLAARPKKRRPTMGWSQNLQVLARQVVVSGSGPSSGVFVYSPSQGFGNLIASTAAVDAKDPYGNAFLAGNSTYFNTGSGWLAVSERQDGLYFFSAATSAGPWVNYALLGNDGANGLLIESSDGSSGFRLSPASGGQLVGTNTALGSMKAPALSPWTSNGPVSNSVAEQPLGIMSIPAGDEAAGSGYRFRVRGSASCATVSPTLTLRMRLGSLTGTVLLTDTLGTVRTANAMPWAYDGWVYFTQVGASGSLEGLIRLGEEIDQASFVDHGHLPGGVAVDTTSPVNLVVTSQWSVANAGNSSVADMGSLERVCH